MQLETIRFRNRAIEPNERISEVLFGLIMVLTFTGSLSVADASRSEVRTMLIGAVGCNIAWTNDGAGRIHELSGIALAFLVQGMDEK